MAAGPAKRVATASQVRRYVAPAVTGQVRLTVAKEQSGARAEGGLHQTATGNSPAWEDTVTPVGEWRS